MNNMINKAAPVTACFLAGIVLSMLLSEQSPPVAHAMTAHGTDQKSIVTVPLESALEAVVTLDHKTGDLTGYVLDRTNGNFFIQYRYNVSEDFPNHRGAYLIAAGLADFRGFKGNERIANGVIYVSEENSGKVAAYGVPWNTQFRASNAPAQRRQFIRLDEARTRFVPIR